MSFVGRTHELGAARRELAARRVLVVTGGPRSDRSAFLDVLAREVADEAGLPVYRVRVAVDSGEWSSEVVLSRLLEACGEAAREALAEPAVRTPGEAADRVVEACRGAFVAHPCVVVVDGVQAGTMDGIPSGTVDAIPTGTADGSLLAGLISVFAESESFLLVGSADAQEGAAPPSAHALDDHTVLLERAVTAHRGGRLGEADQHLRALPSDRRADGRALLTRAAVHCDRGDPRAAGPLLRRAVEAHQVGGDRHGEAWTVFLYGRMCRLRGRAEDARRLLHSAREAFRAVGEARGVAWASGELARLATRSGTPAPEALAEARRLHERAGDRRGAAWAHLWWTVARADEPGFLWQQEFTDVLRRFHEVSDRLGTAWTLHHHALTLTRADGPDGADGTDGTDGTDERQREADRLFERALALFEEADCPHGRAWTMLEYALRSPARRFLNGDWAAEIRHVFHGIGDEAGEAWVDLAEAGPPPDGEPPYELACRYPAALLDAVEWTEAGDPLIPRAARDTQPDPRPDFPRPGSPHPGDRDRPDDFRAHVRLTLLDEAPVPDVPARIALQVVPGPAHPWSTAPLPPLTARATPLGHAEIDPAYAVPVVGAKSYGSESHGAEFRFTPHRPGSHRLRFTLEDPATGTVLQQVEAEIDVVPSDPRPHRPTAPAPRPASARRA
ncbi:tetratricopeptide repeat protein [Streptomyces sp. NBC_01340]|uniref:tetratricopeptide repeat protein n=1 Tax=Streptomyces sp. NBC_01340 TaxID=2903830 RepID=UPI002E165716|nr:tetratricopeptide repeat protein [Streptomyces sp. NBC_01340]